MPEETTGTAASAPPTVMDRVIVDGRIARDDSQRPYAMTLISEYATQVLDVAILQPPPQVPGLV